MEGRDPKEDANEQAPPEDDAVAAEETAASSSAFLSNVLPDQSKLDGRLDPLIGSVLAGRYQILRRIGEGGMGAVYEARHTVIDKRVAVKVLLERLVEKRELVGRLLKEARLASAIGHENIVDVTDFGTTEDARSFVVMEYLDGEPLSALLAREAPLPASRCLNIIRQVASALEAAHDKGIVHRDIKPENIYLIRRGDDDFVKVVDFGVSKAVRTADEGPETLRLTRTGMLLGTPLYMSPEQARGAEDIDARADIWAVGIVFYECLTGEVPFRANNYLQVIAQVLNTEALPPSRMLPELGISASVEAVVMKALAKDRDLRYQRMSDLLVDLERLRSGDPNVTFDEPPSSAALQAQRVGPRWHLGIVGVLLLGAGVAFSLVNTEKAQTIKPVRILKPAPTQPASNPMTQAGVVVAPAPSAAVAPPPIASPTRQRRPAPAKGAVAVPQTPTGPEDKPAAGNIKFLGDDVAPTSDKVFGKASSDAGATRGQK